ncbi:Cof-type HAD-IIB family hydrolase [Paenibacillus thalictri]|uniref:HAD family phosphatase n=1 Tax=Paenibacillus thalictri TaxID=2527873 RepID=A0A4Q9E233_9BACL|nr:Cof-type HAD-IIB family hydrolase [Paenibacillus thalictri]TBL81671.1 HAD family phosphatase [Paenibacillus thalictri]
MYKLLALDMDGTLLDNNKTITGPVLEAIRQLVFNDVHVTIATGRFPASVWLHAKYLGLNFPLVALNGAVILDPITGSELHGTPIEAQIARKIAEYIETTDSYVHFYGYNILFVKELNDMNKRWPYANVVIDPNKELTEDNYRGQVHHIQVNPVGQLSSFLAGTDNRVYKSTVINENPEVVDALYAEFSTWKELEITRTGKRRFDINASGVNKKTALQKVCADAGIAVQDVVTMGDYDNDLEMLKWAGLGIAMGNGNERAKAAARAVTASNNEHGVAEAIRKYFFS